MWINKSYHTNSGDNSVHEHDEYLDGSAWKRRF